MWLFCLDLDWIDGWMGREMVDRSCGADTYILENSQATISIWFRNPQRLKFTNKTLSYLNLSKTFQRVVFVNLCLRSGRGVGMWRLPLDLEKNFFHESILIFWIVKLKVSQILFLFVSLTILFCFVLFIYENYHHYTAEY